MCDDVLHLSKNLHFIMDKYILEQPNLTNECNQYHIAESADMNSFFLENG